MAKQKKSFPVSGPGFRSDAHGVASAREQMRALEKDYTPEPPDDGEDLDNRAMRRKKKRPY